MIELKHLTKTFETDNGRLTALKDVSLSIAQGDIYGIIGFSGAGKSTLVRCINLLERPDTGEVWVDGTELTRLSEAQLRSERHRIGMIFQHFNLMPSRSVSENVAMALKHSTLSAAEKAQKIASLLTLVGLADKANAYPSQLSGGQKQRVAIARALANDPKVLLCDEATSALDPQTTRSILKLLKTVNDTLGVTIVIITHQMSVVKNICRHAAVMEHGVVIEEGPVTDLFAHPKAAVTKGFIDTASNIDDLRDYLEETQGNGIHRGQPVYLLTYAGDETGEPLVVSLYREFQVTANILFGNVDLIDGTAIGKLGVTLSGEADAIRKTLDYIKAHNVTVEVL